MRENRVMFGILIYRKDGDGAFLAHSQCDAPNLFFTRKQARAHKNELREHGFKKTKIVPVEMSLTFPIPEFKKARAART